MYGNDMDMAAVPREASELHSQIGKLFDERNHLAKRLEEINAELRRARTMINDGLGDQLTRSSEER